MNPPFLTTKMLDLLYIFKLVYFVKVRNTIVIIAVRTYFEQHSQ